MGEEGDSSASNAAGCYAALGAALRASADGASARAPPPAPTTTLAETVNVYTARPLSTPRRRPASAPGAAPGGPSARPPRGGLLRLPERLKIIATARRDPHPVR